MERLGSLPPRVSVTRWEKESSPVIHSRTDAATLPSIRRRNYYITDVVVAASSAAAFDAATTTSNQPTLLSRTDARAAGRISRPCGRTKRGSGRLFKHRTGHQKPREVRHTAAATRTVCLHVEIKQRHARFGAAQLKLHHGVYLAGLRLRLMVVLQPDAPRAFRKAGI